MYFLDDAERTLRNNQDENARVMALVAIRSAIRRDVEGIDEFVISLFIDNILDEDEMRLLAEAIVQRNEKTDQIYLQSKSES